MKGLVIKNTGSWVTVRLDDGSTVNCKMRGVLRLKGMRCTNPVAVGDLVQVEDKGGDAPVVGAIDPRKNYIIRRSSNLSKEFQIIAANLDQAVLVATIIHPETSTTFIDRFLATAEAYQVPAVLAFNKIDLLITEESRQYLDEMNLFRRVKDNFIGKAIISLSVCSYGMYFSHVLVVKELSYHNPGSNLLFPLMFAAIVFLSWLLPYLMSKVPYLKTVTGI